jgi:hypothetical protein
MIGDAFVNNLQWTWNWPTWTTTLAGGGAVLWIAMLYAREQPFVSRRVRAALALLRLAALAILIAMLIQPVVSRQRVVRPRLMILADRSASMTTRDASWPINLEADVTGADVRISRFDALRRLLADESDSLIDMLRADYDVEIFAFDDKVQSLAPAVAQHEGELTERIRRAIAAMKPATPADNGTRLGDALDYALRQTTGPRPTAVVAITDGVITQGMELAEAAARARIVGTPIFAVGVGSNRPQADVSLDDMLVEEAAFPGDRLEVEALLHAVGFEGKSIRIALMDAGTSEILAETDVVIAADGETQRVRLALRAARPGALKLRLEASSLPGEANIDNNRREDVVEIRDQPIQALLVASTPNYEYRALKSMLERDPAIALRTLLQDADSDYAVVEGSAISAFPASEADWMPYDVVVLDDVDPDSVPRDTWPNLLEFVATHGGGLALVAGPRFLPQAYRDIRPMETLLPIELPADRTFRAPRERAAKGFIISPTSLGRHDVSLQLGQTADESYAVWTELPPVLWLYESTYAKPGAEVLADHAWRSDAAGKPLPVILRQRVGAGEVLMHTTDETWRWRRRSDDRYFARYWGQAVRRLARGRALRGGPSLSTNAIDYAVGDPIEMRARIRSTAENGANDSVPIRLDSPGIPSREIQLTRNWRQTDAFETTLRELPAGEYVAQLVIDQLDQPPVRARFAVSAPPGEMARLVVNSAGLAEAARMSGGKYYDMTNWRRLAAELPPPRPMAVEQLPDRPLWNSHWLLAMLCLALGAEWLLRRRLGML